MSHVTMLYVTYNMWQKLNWDFSRLVFWLFNYCDEFSSRNFHCGCFYRFRLIWFLFNARAAEIYLVIFYVIEKHRVLAGCILLLRSLTSRGIDLFNKISHLAFRFWCMRQFATLASPRHNASPKRHYAIRANPYEQKMGHFTKKASLCQKSLSSSEH